MSSPHLSEPHLKRVLGLPSVVIFGLAYMVPLTVFSTLGPVAEITNNHVPGAYVITLVCMLFTAVSYGHMSRKFPVSGSAYTYTQRSFGGHAGFLTGWALMLDYLLLPMINYMLLGLYLNAAVPSVPVWVWFVAALLIVTGLNIAGITSIARMNIVLITIQVIFSIVFVILSIRTIQTGVAVDPWAPFFGGDMQFSSILTGAAILCLSFLGFDAVSTLSEETKQPRRVIPIAIIVVTLVGGLVFMTLSWVSYLVIPDWQSFANVDTAANEVIAKAGGAVLSNFFIAAYIAGAMGSALASQASVSRILFTMGRDRVLPHAAFGTVHKRTQTPVRAILIVSLVSIAGLFLPLDFVISIISFGALAGFSLVNLSVVKSYVVDDRRKTLRALLVYGCVPLIGFGLTVWLWTSLPVNALVLGVLWVTLGVVHLAVITGGFRRKPPRIDLAEVI